MQSVRCTLDRIEIIDQPEQTYQKSLGFAMDAIQEKQVDLLYCSAVFASEGGNKNADYFLRQQLIAHRHTPKLKWVDFEHKPKPSDGYQNFKGEKIGMCGNIYDSKLMLEKGSEKIYVTEDQIIANEKNGVTTYSLTVPNADQYRLHIVVAFVVYSILYPDLAEEVRKSVAGDSKMEMSVSMEVMFGDFKLRVGKISPFELFEDTPKGAQDYFKGSANEKMINSLRESKQKYGGQEIVRVIGDPMFFNGVGIVFFPADVQAKILTVADLKKDMLRICTPHVGKDGEVFMECVLSTVASRQKEYMSEYEKVFQSGLDEALSMFRKSGLIAIEETPTQVQSHESENTDFSELLLLYNTQAAKHGILFLIGVPKDGGGSRIQSILFNKKYWTSKTAIEWLKKHNKKVGMPEPGKGFFRFRQEDPAHFNSIHTVTASQRGLLEYFSLRLKDLKSEV